MSSRRITLGILVFIAVIIGSAVQYFGLLRIWQESVFDHFFLQRHAPNNIVIIGIDDESIGALGNWPLPRKDFAVALEHLGHPAAIGFDIAFVDPSLYGASDDLALKDALAKSTAPIVFATQFDDRGKKVIEPLPLFLSVVHEGFVNVLADQDGIVRRFIPSDAGVQSFSSALLAWSGRTTVRSAPSSVRIDYLGKAGTFLTIPFVDVYRGTVPTNVFDGKIVLIGAIAKDIHDIAETPFGALPGTEVHANALATLQSGAFFTDTPFAFDVLSMLIACTLAAGSIMYARRLALLAVLLAGGFILINLLSVLLFTWYIRFPSLSISLAFIICAGTMLLYQYLTESREKQAIRKAFQYYLMPEVIDQIAQNPEKLKLGGEERTVTILFSDIRGFTTISEGLSPRALVHLINDYLTVMTDCIMEQRGLVDKYIGDAIMAFWGAPLENKDQAVDACQAALDMMEKLQDFNTKAQKENRPPIAIGIGINVGEVIVGNMGSSKRFNYTLMGDEVNFASRLEGLTKAYGVRCILSESTARAVEHNLHFIIRELDVVQVKGKKDPRKIFELITYSVDATRRELFQKFEAGRILYTQGMWDEASEQFAAALLLGEDGPSHTFLERCRYLKEHAPEEWSGIYEFKIK